MGIAGLCKGEKTGNSGHIPVTAGCMLMVSDNRPAADHLSVVSGRQRDLFDALGFEVFVVTAVEVNDLVIADFDNPGGQ